jgi:uncharacterized membrane protein YeaQ/YmgE (transglycosylase-associated protein family)
MLRSSIGGKMGLTQLLTWIIIGGVAGVLADVLVKGIKVSLLGAIVVGILGGFVGGWLFGALGISIGTGFLNDVFTALVGAVILLLGLRWLKKR